MLNAEDYFCCTQKVPYRERTSTISSLSRRLKGLNFRGKRVLISYVKVGMGSDLAISLSRLGADLGLIGSNRKELEFIAKKCTGGGTIILKANLCKKHVPHSVVSTFLAEYGGIDVLINLNPKFSYSTIETSSMEEFDRIMNINLRSIYNLILRSKIELMESKGCIINIVSCNGSRAIPNSLVYSIMQATVIQMTRVLAIEMGRSGVRCLYISPSVIETKFNKHFGMKCGQYITFIRNMKKNHALRRVGKSHEVVNCIIYAASGNGKFMTGCDWVVGAGYDILPITKHNFEPYFLPKY